MGRKKISELQIAATLLPNAIQNGNLQVYQLPAEILAYIFLFYKHSTIEHEAGALNKSVFHHDAVPYITPSHVCSYWRRTALDTPSFWSTLLLNHSGWVKELIRRSGRSPLDVHGNQLVHDRHSRATFMRCLSQALQESHRIRSINIGNVIHFRRSLLKPLPQYFTKLPRGIDWFDTFYRVALAQIWKTIRDLEMPFANNFWIPTLPSSLLVDLYLTGIPSNDLHIAL
ncbi:hypothetical protein DL96DRAFT_1618010, partial [Flagelloscypha sp. PMI_526]